MTLEQVESSCLRKMTGRMDDVLLMVISIDGTRVTSCLLDKIIQIRNTSMGEEL